MFLPWVFQAKVNNTDRNVACPEILDDLCYLHAFVNAGWLFTTSTAFYGQECGEGSTVCTIFAEEEEKGNVAAFDRYWYDRLQTAGIPAGPTEPWTYGKVTWYMAEGCYSTYHSFPLSFEINDRLPEHRMTLEGLQGIGADYTLAITDWLALPQGQQVLAAIRTARQQHMERLDDWTFSMGIRSYGNGMWSNTLTQDRPWIYELYYGY